MRVSATSSRQTGTIRCGRRSVRGTASSPGPAVEPATVAVIARTARRRTRGRSSSGCRCDRRPHPSGRPSTARVAVTVVVHGPHVLPVAGGLALAPYSWRLRLQNHERPVSRVRRSDSSFIQANIRTVRSVASWTIAPTRPSRLNAIRPISSSLKGIGDAIGPPLGLSVEVAVLTRCVRVRGRGRCRRRSGSRPRRGCRARAGSRTPPPGPRPRSGPRG